MTRSVIISTVAALLCAMATWLVARWAPKLGLVDLPNQRSMHNRATPRGGGIAVVVVVLGGVTLAREGLIDAFSVTSAGHRVLGWYLTASFVVAAVSLLDDFRSLSSALRLVVHIGAATLLVLGVTEPAGALTAPVEFSDLSPYIVLPVLIAWVVVTTNFYNFIDGIDSMAAIQGIVTGASWTAVCQILALPETGFLAAIITGACVGFAILNWPPAKIFMGDVGSAFLGMTFGTLPLLACSELVSNSDFELANVVLALGIFFLWPILADCSLTLIRRLLRRERIWIAHRSHLYQRLVTSGWSHLQVSLLFGFCAAASSIAGSFLLIKAPIVFPTIVCLVLLAFIIWIVTNRERTPKTTPADGRGSGDLIGQSKRRDVS